MTDLSTVTLDTLPRPKDGLALTIAHQITRILAATNTLYDTILPFDLKIPADTSYWNGEEYTTTETSMDIAANHGLDAMVYALRNVFKAPGEVDDERFVYDADKNSYTVEIPVYKTPESGLLIVTSITLPTGFYLGVTLKPIFDQNFEEGFNPDDVINVKDQYIVSFENEEGERTKEGYYDPTTENYDFIQTIKYSVPDAQFSSSARFERAKVIIDVTNDEDTGKLQSGWVSDQVTAAIQEAVTVLKTSLPVIPSGTNSPVLINSGTVNLSLLLGNDDLTSEDWMKKGIEVPWKYDKDIIPNYNNPLNLDDSSVSAVTSLVNTWLPVYQSSDYLMVIKPGLVHSHRYLKVPSLATLTQTESPISVSTVLAGKTGYANGRRVTGTMVDRSVKNDAVTEFRTYDIDNDDITDVVQVKPLKGYYDGTTFHTIQGMGVRHEEDIEFDPDKSYTEGTYTQNVTFTEPYYKALIPSGYYSEDHTLKIKVNLGNIDTEKLIDYANGKVNFKSNDSHQSGWVDFPSTEDVTINLLDGSNTPEDLSAYNSTDHCISVVNTRLNENNEPVTDFFLKKATINNTVLYQALASI